MKLVIASNNQDKIREIRQILSDFFLEITSMREEGFDREIEENGSSFAENAFLKAKAVFDYTGEAVLADDSGICVDALDGGPGIFSARYSGPNADPEENNRKLLKALEGVPDGERGAHYTCAMVLLRPGKEPLLSEGTCGGSITRREVGSGGFGYDPMFYVPEFRCTMAQLPAEVKNRISHRYRALQGIVEALRIDNETEKNRTGQ